MPVIELLHLLRGIYDAAVRIRKAAAAVRANAAQAATLAARIDGILPQLAAIETATKARDERRRGEGREESSVEAAQLAALQAQLQSLLSVLEDALKLLASYGAADWVSRVSARAKHASSFVSVNEALSQASGDLHLSVDVGASFDADSTLR